IQSFRSAKTWSKPFTQTKYRSGDYYYLFKLKVFPYEVFTQGTRQLANSYEVLLRTR
ncbi:hypothetical protein BU23DRAFT_557547, partial [Bimuria novae-zelandiae CBS 107.79]